MTDRHPAGGKATVEAPSNIAFIKYWGARDLERAIPHNASLSMTLSECVSRSTVEWTPDGGDDEIRWRGAGGELEVAPPSFAERIARHLDFLRRDTGCGGRFRMATENSFPAAAGLASSASGFAALTLAVVAALDRRETIDELSRLARRSGSGSAARSVLGGYVEWPADERGLAGDEERCHAVQVAPAEHWDLRDVIAVVETGAKEVSSLDGHRRAATSPYFRVRQRRLPGRLEEVRRALAERDFERLGTTVEAEAIDLHCVAMTSTPPIYYWQPATLEVLAAVRDLRRQGVAAWSTMDAGANVHVLCEPSSEAAVAERLDAIDAVGLLIRDRVGSGPKIVDAHLF